MSGSLVVVGTGYNVAGHVTPEARASIEGAERFFFLVTDPVTRVWLETLHPTAESLHDAYRVGEPGLEGCERMVERVLAAVRAGHRTCVAFSGHPAICVPPGLESMRRARQEGFPARMLPAVSFEDCLFADLGLDPGVSGRVLYEATDFLIRPRAFDPTVPPSTRSPCTALPSCPSSAQPSTGSRLRSWTRRLSRWSPLSTFPHCRNAGSSLGFWPGCRKRPATIIETDQSPARCRNVAHAGDPRR